MSEAVTEPFTSVNCPFCGALIPFFKKKEVVNCGPCGAELKIGYVQPSPPEPPRAESRKNPVIVVLLRGFAEWLNSKEDEKDEH